MFPGGLKSLAILALMMKQTEFDQSQQSTVCGQAQMVLDNLVRARSLPSDLSLTIEEILERAWEIAYRRRYEKTGSNVIVVPHWGQASAQRNAG